MPIEEWGNWQYEIHELPAIDGLSGSKGAMSLLEKHSRVSFSVAVLFLLLVPLLTKTSMAANGAVLNLEIEIPKGWQLIAAEKLSDSVIGDELSLLKLQPEIRVYIPPNQNEDNWTEMISIQHIRNNLLFSPIQLFSFATAGQSAPCEYGLGDNPSPTKEKGNFVVQGFYLCSRDKTTGKSALLMAKVIETKKRYYTVTRVRRGKPIASEKVSKLIPTIPESFGKWIDWFNKINVGTKGVPYKIQKYSTGTGFLISRSGEILTNHHVVKDCREVRIPPIGKADVEASDSDNDLALINVHRKPKKTAVFAFGGKLRPGEQVVVVGFPLHGLLSNDLNVSTGTVSALAGPNNDRNLIQVSAPIQPGNSGGPVHDPSGNVVGVVIGKLNVSQAQNVNFAISAGTVRKFLDINKVNYKNTKEEEIGGLLNAADIADNARKYTLLVECWK